MAYEFDGIYELLHNDTEAWQHYAALPRKERDSMTGEQIRSLSKMKFYNTHYQDSID